MAKLAELHLHLYGCIRAAELLEMLAHTARPAWERYEPAYERAFGVRPHAREIVERHRRGDPSARAAFESLFVFGDEDAGSFARFQAKFDLIAAASRVGLAYAEEEHVPAALAEIRGVARAVLEDQSREGIGYAEQRFFFGGRAPLAFVEAGLDTLLDVYASDRGDGVDARLAVSLPRRDPWAQWELVSRTALGPRGHALTGIDFCFVEEGHPPKEQRALFDAVREHNERHPERTLAILYHVGESFSDKSLESAVRWVQEAAEAGAHRLGHAIALGVDPDTYGPHVRRESVGERRDQIAYDLRHADDLERAGVRVDRAALDEEARRLADRRADETIAIRYDHARLSEVRARQRYAMRRVRSTGAVIEVCPTSNLRIGGIRDPEHHPVHRFLDAGLPVVVASDDPGIFGTRLERELDWVARVAELAPEELAAIRERAWTSRSEVVSGREAASRRR